MNETSADFQNDKQRAIDQMREMNKRATSDQHYTNEYNQCTQKTLERNLINGINIPQDALLIFGLIFILSKEKCDKLLLLALLYILV